MSAAPASSPVSVRQPATAESSMLVPNPTPASASWMAHAQPPPPPSSSYAHGGDADSQDLLLRRNLLAEAVKRASVAIVVRDLEEFNV